MIAISSLTFKHLFPSFDNALRNLAHHLGAGGVIAFDLIEGSGSVVEDDGETFVRRYQRGEVTEMVGRAGLELVAFDEVVHHRAMPATARLLVVATRRDGDIADGIGDFPRGGPVVVARLDRRRPCRRALLSGTAVAIGGSTARHCSAGWGVVGGKDSGQVDA